MCYDIIADCIVFIKAYFPLLLYISSWAMYFVWFLHSPIQFANTIYETYRTELQTSQVVLKIIIYNLGDSLIWFLHEPTLHEAKILQLMFSSQLSSYHLSLPFLASSQCNQIPASSCMQVPWAISCMCFCWWICWHMPLSYRTAFFYSTQVIAHHAFLYSEIKHVVEACLRYLPRRWRMPSGRFWEIFNEFFLWAV